MSAGATAAGWAASCRGADAVPYGVVPTSSGRSATTKRATGTSSSDVAAVMSAAYRQPGPLASTAKAGRKMSCPVELAAEKNPVTRPRLVANHRLATTEPSTKAIAPVPTPTNRPHSTHSCHGWLISTVSPLPTDTSSSAAVSTRRRPKRSMRAAANGAVSP